MPRTFRRSLAAGAALVLLQNSSVFAAAAPPPVLRDKVWPQTYSDLPADPSVRFGVLPNGMRYALMHNETPRGQVSLRLRIGSGSLEESDAQQGLAHMLEHMAFKGSVHAPNGEMVKMLERVGLSFGGDTNARTGFTDTVYQLDLPQGDPKTLDVGLTLLSDIGDGLLLKPEALDSERGVVLSEERLRDTPDYEVTKQRLAFELQGQLAADRLPIGKVSIIQTAPPALVRAFYSANYRPDRATLIAVGDFDPAAMEADIRRLFGGWRGVGTETPAPNLGEVTPRGEATQLIVRKGASPSLVIAWASPHDDTPDSLAKERRDFVENLAFAALNRRFERAAHSADPPFLSAGAARSDQERSARLAQIQVLFRPARWREALQAATVMQRQALSYGFSQGEVDREITETGVSLRNAAAGAGTRRTPSIAEELIRSVDDQEVETSPDEDLRLFGRFTQGLTAAEVSQALRDAFKGSGPLVSLATPEPIDGGEGGLASAFHAAETAPVAPPVALRTLSWTHTHFGAPGQVADTRTVADLGVTFVRFANGVKLTVKPTAFRKDQVQVSVNFGHGRLELPRDRIAADWATPAFVTGGLSDLTYEDMQQVLADRTVSVGLSVGDDAYTLAGATRPQDLEVQAQLLAAYMTAPGWRPEAFTRTQGLLNVALAQLSSTPQGVEARDLPALTHSGDARWRYPEPAEVRATRLDQLKALIDPALTRGPLEVVVTGDVTVDAAVKAVAATFGALPPRQPEAIATGEDQVRFPSASSAPVTRQHHGRADQAIAYVGWPAADLLSDPQRARRINIAAQVLQLRLIDQVRIAEGASYSPAAGASESDVFPGYGSISASVETPPAKVAGFYADVAKITADLRTRPISADEFRRAVRPRIESIERAQQTNGYWSAMLHDAQDDPRRLELIRSSIPGYRKMTEGDVKQAAQAYLIDSTAWRFQVEPAGAVSPTVRSMVNPQSTSRSACVKSAHPGECRDPDRKAPHSGTPPVT